MNIFTPFISEHLHIRAEQVDATLDLLDAGCTIPFISRYRKEATGNLNEVQEELVTQMCKDLCDQIFNATVANW